MDEETNLDEIQNYIDKEKEKFSPIQQELYDVHFKMMSHSLIYGTELSDDIVKKNIEDIVSKYGLDQMMKELLIIKEI